MLTVAEAAMVAAATMIPIGPGIAAAAMATEETPAAATGVAFAAFTLA